jgi:Zn-finger protein
MATVGLAQLELVLPAPPDVRCPAWAFGPAYRAGSRFCKACGLHAARFTREAAGVEVWTCTRCEGVETTFAAQRN